MHSAYLGLKTEGNLTSPGIRDLYADGKNLRNSYPEGAQNILDIF